MDRGVIDLSNFMKMAEVGTVWVVVGFAWRFRAPIAFCAVLALGKRLRWHSESLLLSSDGVLDPEADGTGEKLNERSGCAYGIAGVLVAYPYCHIEYLVLPQSSPRPTPFRAVHQVTFRQAGSGFFAILRPS